ncbi:MAG: YggT family protein [Deltaproteobacteria bacterium]|jgi:YggT family protein|nr:YggT family protein [Deltaproteobacteria bacterium]
MFVVGNFLSALARILDIALTVYMWLVIARALLSWVNPDPYNPIVRFLYNTTEPVLQALRRRLPLFFGGVDFSPLLVVLVIVFLQRFAVASLQDLAVRLAH